VVKKGVSLIEVCKLCGGVNLHKVGYLHNMSIIGKVFGLLPLFVSKFLPPFIRGRFIHGKKLISTFRSVSWVFCKDCDFGFVSPPLSEKELNSYYSFDYWKVRSRKDLSGIIHLEENVKRPKIQLNFLKDSGLNKVDNMLDFGAGMCGGTILFKGDNFFQKNTILDKSAQSFEISDLLGVKKIDNTKDALNDEFDFIYSSHSLEHVNSLENTLKEFHRILSYQGYVFIEVPNIKNYLSFISAHHAPHTYTFSQKSLHKAMQMHGFDFISCKEYGDLVFDVHTSVMCLFKKRSL